MNSVKGTLQVSWEGEYGPDGPWHAVTMDAGVSRNSTLAAAWPDWRYRSKVLSPALGGNYTVTDSASVFILGQDEGGCGARETKSQIHGCWRGKIVVDYLKLERGDRILSFLTGGTGFNATLDAVEEWVYELPDGSNYSVRVGTLGLGVSTGELPGILQSWNSSGVIASTSFGLHMGSAALGQPASLVFGGYEKNRALGSVGVFPLDRFRSGSSILFLVDVLLGTQVGGSPFAGGEGSVWQGTKDTEGDSAEKTAQAEGAKSGTALVVLDPTVPYIYLPPGTCEAAARRLPVRWNDRLGLYLWDTGDPTYQRIVRSPAYLSFVFSDPSATNITIKVPFRLLNLMLEPPLMPTPTPYFPCKPWNTEDGIWALGRAFLQAAFVGANFEQDITFLAQAPGPEPVQRVVQILRPGDTTLQTSPIEEFERSWLPSWTVLEEDGNRGLSTGSVVGIVLGVVAALTAAAVAVWFFWRRKVKQPEALRSEVAPKEQPEMDGQGRAVELGKPIPHELQSPAAVYELPISNVPER
ncbi:aspartic peptidase domain-containing protein [Chaetomium tenue]|uniref:Aspartic peptidase domain-containing protein n=1 Tax=Chaetomium tenue TaxID=1854479 RepID=A0ACB7P5F0_9PEZI|nr:aspartic peptidase domain-containing protein [Chaetomium globosum]